MQGWNRVIPVGLEVAALAMDVVQLVARWMVIWPSVGTGIVDLLFARTEGGLPHDQGWKVSMGSISGDPASNGPDKSR